MSTTAGGIPVGGSEKGEVHTESPQPLDLGHGHGHTLTHSLSHATHVLRANSPVTGATSVVQIRPMRTLIASSGSLIGGKGGVSIPGVVTGTAHPSIIVNRTGPNLTILPRPAIGQGPTGTSVTSGISTLQFTRGTLLQNVRPNTGAQPTSITVTPISPSSFTGSIRLSPNVNNGSWIQAVSTTGSPPFNSIRPTTIQVSSRPIRPEISKIHIPLKGTVQHLTQLQVVDSKGSILKPNTPISVRSPGIGGMSLPLAPFTIRATAIQRPSPSVITTTSQAQKVITQPAHGPPIIVNATTPKFTQLQNFSTIPRIPIISISSANGGNTVTGSSSSFPHRQSNPSLIMSNAGSSGAPAQLTKVYPLSREVSTTLVESYINQGHVTPQQNHINSPTLTVVSNANSSYTSTTPQIRPTYVITSAGTGSTHPNNQQFKGIPSQIVQLTSPISLQSNSYYIEPKNIAIFPKKDKGGGGLVISNEGGSLATQFAHPIPTTNQKPPQTPALIATTSVTTTTSSPSSLTTTSTSIVTLAVTSGTAISTITTTSSTTLNSTTTPRSVSSPSPSSTTATSTTTPAPAQSPSQSKATLSPRPSILRKREAGACETNFVPLRAQRNLTVNFTALGPTGTGTTLPNNNNNTPSSLTPSTSSTTPTVLISTVSNKENNSTTGFQNFGIGLTTSNLNSQTTNLPGVSIHKKEFQPPNEESSWQSCSSNSSSGSTTISATSDTAEIGQDLEPPPTLQIQPQPILRPIHQPITLNINPIQNGVLVRGTGRGVNNQNPLRMPSAVSIVSGNHSTPRQRGNLIKGQNKGRKEVVSPRKKPRKQQLTTSDFIESSSQEISFYQAKRFKRNDGGIGKLPSDKTVPTGGVPPPSDPPQPDRIPYLLKKPRTSLFETNKFLPNLRHNHFKRYSDVKSKDERRPTISDLANQKNVLTKVGGWKLKHLTLQMDSVINSEIEVISQFNSLLSEINSEDFVTSTNSNRDLSRIEDLLKGNLQRCKVVKDQITESRSQVTKVLEHHPRILDVINKHINKRPVKKKEKL